ncbi:MAG: hydroxyisourate hydrolase [Bacteroidota bacterium]
MSQITTHILDTSKGKPAQGIQIILEKQINGNTWSEINRGNTNDDGRLPGLVTENTFLEFGVYRLVFDTETYYKNTQVEGLYPSVSIAFKVYENKHYHIPLLLNPFGYSTYRGS